MAFNWLKNAVTGPFRGIANLLQGKPRAALGAFGDTAKPLGIALTATGVGAPIGLPMAAAGGVAQKFDDEGHRGITDMLRGGLEGASLAYGAGQAGNLVRGGVGALTGGGAAPGVVPTPDLGTAVANTNRTVSGLSTVAPTAVGEGSKSVLTGIANYLKENPEIPLGVAEMGLGYASERERGGAVDRWQRIQEEEMARRAKLAELQTLMQFVAGSMGRRY